MATLEELVVRIKADASQLDRELKRVGGTVQQSTTRMSAGFAGLKRELASLAPALGAAALVSFAKKAIDTAGRITDLGQQIGFAANTLSALETPLAKSGATLDQFAASVNLMNANIGNAVSGNEELAKKFSRLGLSVEELQKLSPEQQFYTIADALSRVETQYEQTEIGRAIFGRGFSALIPLLKDANGNLGETVDRLKGVGDGLSEETLKRVDDFGDALAGAAIKGRNAFLELFATILEVNDYLASTIGAGAPGSLSQARLGILPQDVDAQNQQAAYLAKAQALGFKTSAAVMGGDEFGPSLPRSSKRISPRNKELENATKAYRDYIQAIEDENYLLHINEKERDGVRAVMEAEALAKKANIDLSEEERQQIMGLVNSNRDLKESMAEAARFSQELKDKFSDALADIVFSFDGATDSAKRFAEQIAKMIVEKKITGPLAEGILGLIDGSGGSSGSSGSSGGGIFSGIASIFSGLGFADGGRPPVGKASVVGERGPELFIPDSAGTVIPNGGFGGKQITIVQNWNISPGIQGTVEAEVRRAAPGIINQSVRATVAAIERGGSEARSVGRRQ